MEREQHRKSESLFNDYVAEFADCFARSESFRHMATYIRGQLSDLPRKSIHPIATAAGIPPRSLQQFLSRHSWDEELMRDRLQQIIARSHQHPCSIGVIDETGYPKKGDRTPGVEQQWCPATGRAENCALTIHLGYVANGFHCLLDGELFLSRSWTENRQRCRSAGIASTVTYRPKWQIALEMCCRAVANGIRFDWVSLDEHYGQVSELLYELDTRGQRYVAQIPPTFTGRAIRPVVLPRRRSPDRLFGRNRPRWKGKRQPGRSVENLCRYSQPMRIRPWEHFEIESAEADTCVWQAKVAEFYLERDGLPSRPHWLIPARRVEPPGELTYFLSNAPESVPLKTLLQVACTRQWAKECFQEEKKWLGLDHFEVRKYLSLRRHLVLTSVSHLFLARIREMQSDEAMPC